MGMNANYTLDLKVPPNEAVGFDFEYFMFQMRKAIPEVKYHLDDNGKSTGSDGSWREIERDMKAFSLTKPGYLFIIVESGEYDGHFEYRYYFKDGKMVQLEPVMTWPVFDENMLK